MIKLATIGSSWITEKFIQAALSTQKYQLVAVYSRDKEKGLAFAQSFGVNCIYQDLTKLAKSNDIDAVYIASPNSLHYEQAKLFLEHKKHVICEKPLTANEHLTTDLITTAKENDCILLEALKIYSLPNYQIVKDYLPKLGQLRKAFLNYCQYSSRYPKYLAGENPNTFNPEFANGSLMDIGVYPLNFALGLWGKPQHVQASATLLDSGVDGHGSVLMNYGAFDVVIAHSKVSDSCLESEIQGEAGSLIIKHLSIVEEVIYKPRQGEALIVSQKHVDNDMVYEALQFATLIQQHQVDHQGLKDSLLASELLTQIRQLTNVVFPSDYEH